MKRIPAVMLLVALSLACAIPAKAQIFTGPDHARRAQKAAQKQQKATAKNQRKAMKKYQKAQRKATKGARRRG